MTLRRLWLPVLVVLCLAFLWAMGRPGSTGVPGWGGPCDPEASPAARALLEALAQGRGGRTLSGQQTWAETEYVRSLTGRSPALMGGDLMDYSRSRRARGADPKRETETMLEGAARGQIITLCWHWNAPKDLIDKSYPGPDGQVVDARWYKGFYTRATRFDLERALANPGSEDYQLLLADMDAVAVELKKLSDAGVPVLWRPLHEAEGQWFWWGARGPGPFKALWRLMFHRLSQVHQLHNLIWVYSATVEASPDWYPGDDCVDIVGIDAYPQDPGDPMLGPWRELRRQYGTRKPLALTEFGGAPDIAGMHQAGVNWVYFVSWSGPEGLRLSSRQEILRTYADPATVQLGDLRP